MSSTTEATFRVSRAAGRHRKEPGRSEGGFRPDIQGLRAIAVSLVVIYHVYPSVLPGGFAGVDVFFVISGYLITGHLWRTCRKTGRVGLTDFWGRRARRLIPAAAVVLAVTWVVSYLVLPSTQLAETAAQIRASALYFQNWQLASEAVNYLKSGSPATPVQHFWSLSVEEQFYLIWPLLFGVALLTARHWPGRNRATATATATGTGTGTGTGMRVAYRTVVALTAALVLASLAYSIYDTRADEAQAYFVTTTRMWELGAGGLLALLPAGISDRLGRHGWLGWAGLAMIIASQFVLNGSTAFPGWIALAPVLGALALIGGGSSLGRLGPWRLTSARPMAFLGGISYSLYLWHFPVIVLWTAWRGHSPGALSGPLLIVASVGLAWLTKITVEDRVRLAPFIARHQWRSLSMALAAVVPVTLATAFLIAQPGAWNGKLGPGYPGATVLARKLASVPAKPVLPPPDDVSRPGYWASGCLEDVEVAAVKPCYFGDTKNPTLKIALVGDSMAGNWWAPLEQIATHEHWELITELHATCAWTATQMYDGQNKGAYPACYHWGAGVLHDLVTTLRPDVVITSEVFSAGSLAHPVDSSQSRADVGAGEATYWKDLQAHGIGVIAIKETPITTGVNPPACVAKLGPDAKRCTVPISQALPVDPPTSYADRDVGGTVPVIDMNPLICGPTSCPPVVGNVLVYMDTHHLTQAYAQTLAPYLRDKLSGALVKVLPPAKQAAIS